MKGGFLGLFDSNEDQSKNKRKENKDHPENSQEQKLTLRKEELDLAKNKVDIGKVEFGKEIVEEQQTINVPLVHEEVVVERKSVNEPSEEPIIEGDDENFTLSVGEERVEVGKHTVVTGEVKAHKREIEENRQVTETVKHEEARINKDGDAQIVDEQELH